MNCLKSRHARASAGDAAVVDAEHAAVAQVHDAPRGGGQLGRVRGEQDR